MLKIKDKIITILKIQKLNYLILFPLKKCDYLNSRTIKFDKDICTNICLGGQMYFLTQNYPTSNIFFSKKIKK